MLFSSYIVIRTTSNWMRSCPTAHALIPKKPMSKNCPVLSLVLHLHPEACWCSKFWRQFLTVIQGQKKLYTVISTCTLCQSDGREYSLYMRAWLTVFTLRWWALPHWCCLSLQQVRSAASMIFPETRAEICCINDIFPETRAERSKFPVQLQNAALRASEIRILPHKLRKQRSLPFCTTSGVRPPSVHVVARRESGRTFFSSAKGVTLRESPLSLAKNTKTWAPRQCQRRAICPQQPNIFLTSNADDVDQSWKRVPFTDSFPVCQAIRKTVALHSTLLVLLGEKSGRWSSSPRHGAFWNRSCAHRFAPKWSALTMTAPTQRSQWLASPGYTVLRALQRSDPWMKVEWTSHAHAMKHGRDRSRKRARPQWARACRWFWSETWILGGFIGNGEPPPPLCTRLMS